MDRSQYAELDAQQLEKINSLQEEIGVILIAFDASSRASRNNADRIETRNESTEHFS